MTAFIIYKAIMCVGIFVLLLASAAYATLWERKFAAFLQDRKGPSRAGWGGLLMGRIDLQYSNGAIRVAKGENVVMGAQTWAA